MSPRLNNAQLRAQGRYAERADVVAQIRQSLAGALAIATNHRGSAVEPGIDLTIFMCRLEALAGTIEAGCHEGLHALLAECVGRTVATPAAVINAVLDERLRQISAEGWAIEHDDDAHPGGELAAAAAAYALEAATLVRRFSFHPLSIWPWDEESWKPKDARSNLVRAGALIIAEIERIDRAALASNGDGQ